MNKFITLQGITPSDLLNQIDTIIQSRIKEHLEKQQGSNFEKAEYRKGTEVCKYLGISAPTLYSYVERGLITRYEIAGRPKYNTKEIVALLIEIEQKRA